MREALAALTVRGRAFLAAGITTVVARDRARAFLAWSASACWSRSCRCSPPVDRPLPLPPRARPHASAPAARGRRQPATVELKSPTTAARPRACCCSRSDSPTSSAPGRASSSRASGTAGAGTSTTRCARTCAASSRSARCGPGHRPLRPPRARPHVPRHDAGSPSPRARAPAAHPARWRLDRLRRQPAPRLRHRQRGGRHGPGVPPRRRPAARPLAQLGPRRRADGAPRGAAVAVAGDRLPRQPRHRPPRTGAAARSRRAVSAAASIAVHLAHGYTVRLVTASGEETEHGWHSRSADASTIPLLEAPRRGAARPLPRARHPVAGRARPRRPHRRGLRRLERPPTCRSCAACSTTPRRACAIALDVDAWAPHLPVQPGPGAAAPASPRPGGARSPSARATASTPPGRSSA